MKILPLDASRHDDSNELHFIILRSLDAVSIKLASGVGIGIDSNFENRFQNRLIATNRISRFDLKIRFSVSNNRF
jgi:hypothetical protein